MSSKIVNYNSLFFAGIGGDVAAVGRGGMRGRRRVNESECLMTRPTNCATKQGE